MRECGFERVVGTQDVDVDDGFHGVGTDGGDWGEEIACCAGATPMITCLSIILLWLEERLRWQEGINCRLTSHSQCLRARSRIVQQLPLGFRSFVRPHRRLLALLILNDRFLCLFRPSRPSPCSGQRCRRLLRDGRGLGPELSRWCRSRRCRRRLCCLEQDEGLEGT